MTLREYIEKSKQSKADTSGKEGLAKGSHSKYDDDYNEKGGMKGSEKKGPSDYFTKGRSSKYRSDENESSSGADNKSHTGDFFSKQRDANKYTDDRPEGKRGRDETPSYFTSQRSHNKYDTDRLGDKGSEKPESGRVSFLKSKKPMPGYRSDENESSSGVPNRERRGSDLDAFTGRNRKKQ